MKHICFFHTCILNYIHNFLNTSKGSAYVFILLQRFSLLKHRKKSYKHWIGKYLISKILKTNKQMKICEGVSLSLKQVDR